MKTLFILLLSFLFATQCVIKKKYPLPLTDPEGSVSPSSTTVSTGNTQNGEKIIVSPSTGLTVTEGGQTTTFQITLGYKPTGNVTIPINSSNTAEGTLSVTSLTFTPSDWNIPQTVTITGVDDNLIDGSQVFSINFGATTSTDSNFSGYVKDSISATNADNDSPGITLNPNGGTLTTTEAGGTAQFTLVLNTQPTDTVTISTIASSNTAEGTLNASSITFTTANWNIPQTITITGVNDSALDGNKQYTVSFSNSTSNDANYNNIALSTIQATNTDNETPSVNVSPTMFTLIEGNSNTFSVSLGVEPSATVTIPLTNANTSQVSMNKTELVFTPANWNIAQTVTINALTDAITETPTQYTIGLGTIIGFGNFDPTDVTVTITDVPAYSVTVTPTTLTLSEGATGTFQVVLGIEPSGDVTIPVSSSDTNKATVDKTTLTFTTANWNVPQTITVASVDNFVAGGNSAATIILGAATNYGSVDPTDVSLSITENDVIGVTVSNASAATTETGGTTTFTVVLTSQPTTDVTIPINEKYDAKNNTNQEGTIDKTSLTFTPANWNTTQTVTVTGVNDDIDDGNINYVIQVGNTTSTDSNYNGINPNDVTVTNNDNDTSGFIIAAATGIPSNAVTVASTTTTSNSATTISGLATDDMGNIYTTFRIKLRSQPTENVVLNLASDSTSDGVPNQSSLTFTTADWNTDQTVTVNVTNAGNTHTDVNEGNHDYNITITRTTNDITYKQSSTAVISPIFKIHSCDNDASNEIVYCRKSGSFNTSEANTSKATFWLITKSIPGSDITVPVSLTTNSDEATLTTGSPSVAITSTNYNSLGASTTNKIETQGVNDALIDGNVQYTVALGTASGGSSFDPTDVNIRNNDDEILYTVGTASGDTTENGGSATFPIRLNVSPEASETVTFTVSCGSNTECNSVSPTSLSFTNGNWSVDQIVTVTGKNDNKVDGRVAFNVNFGTSTSGGLFDSSTPPAKGMYNLDNDKIVFLTNMTTNGNMTSGITQADINCNNDTNKPGDAFLNGITYKAMLIDGVNRIATITPDTANGQLNWVFAPSTQYYNTTKTSSNYQNRIFTTDTFGLFSFGSLTNAFSSTASDVWTGLNTNWTTSSNTCNQWKGDIGFDGQFGISNLLTNGSINSNFETCTSIKKLLCVQQ